MLTNPDMNITSLLQLDAQFSEKIRLVPYPPFIKQVMSILAHSADSWYWGAGLAMAWMIGPQGWRSVIKLLFIGIIVTALFVQGLKFLIKRPRPEGAWGQIYRRSDPHSFPSGHAARATMLTLIILLSGHLWFGLLMILWTLLVDTARVGLGVHFLSDIIIGTAIGALFGGLVFLIFG